MRNKDYRELQISSSMLIFVFIAIIVLGIVIFLLGVSVGKKQAIVTEQTQFAQAPIEKIQEQTPVTPEQTEEKINQEIASHKENIEKKQPKKPTQKTEPPPSTAQNLYYI